MRLLFTAGFLLSGLYHLVGLINPLLTEPSPAWRHGLFMLVNFTGAIVLLRAKKKMLFILFPLIIQQIFSHGVYGYEVWINEGRIDWASVIVLITMPLLAVYILKQNKRGT